MELSSKLQIKTIEMHTGGEPLRIVASGYPDILGSTILEKRKYARKKLDHLRKFLMFEPRGHFDMYGALIVKPDLPGAHFGVLFIHNEGYSTMCGHAVIALGRYALDHGLAQVTSDPEIQVNIQCPCGMVKTYVDSSTKEVRFHSVPAFAFSLDVNVNVKGYGSVTLDIGYGGAFYALISAQQLGLDVSSSSTADLVKAAAAVSEAVRGTVKLSHPDSEELAFLYGTIITDGKDQHSQEVTANICVFANKEVDRCPTGSGVTARVAVQYARGLIQLGQVRTFRGPSGTTFTGKAVEQTECGAWSAVVVEVTGKAYYTGTATFTLEDEDPIKAGFLLK